MVKDYPEGPRVRVTSAWRRQTRDRLAELGIKLKDLATMVNATKGAVSQLLSEHAGPKTSALALPVSKITGVAVPGYEEDDQIASFAKMAKELRNLAPHRFAEYERHIDDQLKTLRLLSDNERKFLSALVDNAGREARHEENPASKPGGRRRR